MFGMRVGGVQGRNSSRLSALRIMPVQPAKPSSRLVLLSELQVQKLNLLCCEVLADRIGGIPKVEPWHIVPVTRRLVMIYSIDILCEREKSQDVLKFPL